MFPGREEGKSGDAEDGGAEDGWSGGPAGTKLVVGGDVGGVQAEDGVGGDDGNRRGPRPMGAS